MSEEIDPDRVAIVVCVRVVEAKPPWPCEQSQCQSCHMDVWISPVSTVMASRLRRELFPICAVCWGWREQRVPD